MSDTEFRGRVFEVILDGKLVEIKEEHIVEGPFGTPDFYRTLNKSLIDHCERNPK